MERDSFIFYKSFYEAIRDLPKDIRLEVYTAIMEYALYGRQPDDLKPFARGIFTLVKPNIDVNTVRFENGMKGGRKNRSKEKEKGNAQQQTAEAVETPKVTEAAETITYEQEVEMMRADGNLRETICKDFRITAEEYGNRLTRFLARCNEDGERKGRRHHDSTTDCHNHFRYWMTKAYQQQPKLPAGDNSYEFKGGFGGVDV